MELKILKTREHVTIHIFGAVSKIEESGEIKRRVNELLQQESQTPLYLVFEDAFIITSALLGYLVKLIQGEETEVFLIVKHPQLYALLEKMSLVELLNVRRG